MPGPVLPDYGGAWVGGVVPTLLEGRRAEWLPKVVSGATHVVLLVLDGVGWTQLSGRSDLPVLGGLEGGPITTVAPTTTSAALTSISTGLPPSVHGVVGYRMRVGGAVLNVLGWYAEGTKAPDPRSVQPHESFLGRAVPLVTRIEFTGTGFTGAHLRGGRFMGWRTTSALVEQVRLLVEAGEPFVYAYYDGVDKVAHGHGLDADFYPAELRATDRLVGALLDALPSEAVLVVTSDHGQVDVPPAGRRSLEPLSELIGQYSGEGRFRSLYARSGAARELESAAVSEFGDQAWVFSRERLFDEGWLGPGAAAEVRSRVGDVVLAAFRPVAFLDPGQPFESMLLAHHGSLTEDEMLVPLLAGRGRR